MFMNIIYSYIYLFITLMHYDHNHITVVRLFIDAYALCIHINTRIHAYLHTYMCVLCDFCVESKPQLFTKIL